MAHVLWFAGLRGAVAYACVREFPSAYGHDDAFISATMFIILFTVIIMGGGTEYLLEYLGIKIGVDEEQYMFQWRKERELKGSFHDLGMYNWLLVLGHHFRTFSNRSRHDSHYRGNLHSSQRHATSTFRIGILQTTI